jgi:hypothetical protein
MSYEEIGRRTIPQIEEILRNLDIHISIKAGIPGLFGGAPIETGPAVSDGKPPKLSDLQAFADAFNGIG